MANALLVHCCSSCVAGTNALCVEQQGYSDRTAVVHRVDVHIPHRYIWLRETAVAVATLCISDAFCDGQSASAYLRELLGIHISGWAPFVGVN